MSHKSKHKPDEAVHGYVGHLEVTAYPYSPIPHYTVVRDGFTTNINTTVKKGTYVGTVKFLNYDK